jgi:hypothetical protein
MYCKLSIVSVFYSESSSWDGRQIRNITLSQYSSVEGILCKESQETARGHIWMWMNHQLAGY